MGHFLFYILIASQVARPADAWCDVVFKDVAQRAEIVLIATAVRPKGGETELHVLDVIKGEVGESVLNLSPRLLREYGVKSDDHVLLALTGDRELVAAAPGMGACFPVSLVRFRGKRLRGRDREGYDSRNDPMTLEELRLDLLRPSR